MQADRSLGAGIVHTRAAYTLSFVIWAMRNSQHDGRYINSAMHRRRAMDWSTVPVPVGHYYNNPSARCSNDCPCPHRAFLQPIKQRHTVPSVLWTLLRVRARAQSLPLETVVRKPNSTRQGTIMMASVGRAIPSPARNKPSNQVMVVIFRTCGSNP